MTWLSDLSELQGAESDPIASFNRGCPTFPPWLRGNASLHEGRSRLSSVGDLDIARTSGPIAPRDQQHNHGPLAQTQASLARCHAISVAH
jgi:hypothetical protein